VTVCPLELDEQLDDHRPAASADPRGGWTASAPSKRGPRTAPHDPERTAMTEHPSPRRRARHHGRPWWHREAISTALRLAAIALAHHWPW
jgi:hypothetical protein